MAICFEHNYSGFEEEMRAEQRLARELAQSPIVDSHRFSLPPPFIHCAEAAFSAIAYVAKNWARPLILVDGTGKKTRWARGERIELSSQGPQDLTAEADALDHDIARFVSDQPGALEMLLLDENYQDQLALTRAGQQRNREPYKSVLLRLLAHASPLRGELLWRTLRACDSAAILRWASDSLNRYRPLIEKSNVAWGIPFGLLSGLAARLGPMRCEQLRPLVKPPELQDVLMLAAVAGFSKRKQAPATQFKLPEILPPTETEIVAMGPQAVSRQIASYVGTSVENLHDRLRANRFLAKNDLLGDIIVADAKTLLRLGVSRLDLATKLRGNIVQGALESRRICYDPRGELLPQTARRATYVAHTLGHHQDPFHSADTYYLSDEVGGSADCKSTDGTTVVHHGDMLPYMIRRACFFEGNVHYRLEPAAICEVLGLV